MILLARYYILLVNITHCTTSKIAKMSSPAPLLFLIIGRNEPLYSSEFGKPPGTPATAQTISRQNYIVMHSALDLVEKSAWVNSNMYLKVVDQVNHQMVSTFLTACHVKFMLLHTGKSEDTVRNFFNEMYELYTKVRSLFLVTVPNAKY